MSCFVSLETLHHLHVPGDTFVVWLPVTLNKSSVGDVIIVLHSLAWI